LELSPDDKAAAEALAELSPMDESAPPPEGGGFLKRIFRR
jgi:hypothetical protein